MSTIHNLIDKTDYIYNFMTSPETVLFIIGGAATGKSISIQNALDRFSHIEHSQFYGIYLLEDFESPRMLYEAPKLTMAPPTIKTIVTLWNFSDSMAALSKEWGAKVVFFDRDDKLTSEKRSRLG